jgi:predicted lipoprotein with Yx(FWY)xxD motif
MRSRITVLTALLLVIAACGGSDTATESSTTTAPATTTTTAAAEAMPGVELAETSLGEVLAGPEGMTLYGFTVDDPGVSNCYDACEQAWPPLSGDTPIGAGLDASLFSTTEREDGTSQLVIGDWPLYYFAGDSAPGDVNGQDVEGVWFVVDAGGSLVGNGDALGDDGSEQAGASPADRDDDYDYGTTEAPGIKVAETELGPTLVNAEGMTLYGFTPDTPTESACTGGCAENWPPVPADTEVSGDLDASLFTTLTRDDGSTQLVFGDWPLYLFAADSRPGDISGQGVNDVWFVIGPDATLYR